MQTCKWLSAALVFAFFPSLPPALAVERCPSEQNPVCREWLDQSGPHGVRLVIRDNRWKWFDTHSGTGIRCATCSAAGIAAGLLHFGLLDPAKFGLQSRAHIDAALEPELVSYYVWVILDGDTRFPFRAEGATTPISIWGLTGKSRGLAFDIRGRTEHILALALEDGAASVFAVFSAKDGRELASNDVEAVASALALEAYLPPPSSLLWVSPRPPPEPEEFHIGDLRRLLLGEQP